MKLFCWPKEQLIPIQVCFACDDRNRCKSYAIAYRKHTSEVERLKQEWDSQEPEIEIIIRRKKMPEKKGKQTSTGTSTGATAKQQMYYFVSKASNDGKEVQEIATEDRILEIVKSGGQIVQIYKLGEEQEVVIKIQKKIPTA